MSLDSNISIEFQRSYLNIPAKDWDALTGGMPLLSHAFLSALERSDSIGQDTGWIPYPILVKHGERLIGAMPLFLKTHSYGEYVFDWAWADAYARSGLNYYPKWVSAIPFTPITSSRLLTDDPAISPLIIQAIESAMQQHGLSSAHVLFPDEVSASALVSLKWLKRVGVQFRWQNKNYVDFEDFLNTLSHNKRKKIHQERKKVEQAGVQCKSILGTEITEADWDFFYLCYCNTYAEHHSTPYLTRAFFTQIGKTMPQHIVLFVAEMNHQPIASALNIYDKNALYGRYWGTTQFVSGLHFELCYYQAQQFCITNGIEYFEGGAQGEHKLARGFEPRPTCSFHKIVDSDFELAIQDFLIRESAGIAEYTSELEERAPFKSSSL